ncbi:MAG: outer membrane beta-barrel protein [Deltaproteobacteria bacterium]|nr:outer membrane beta-barrel protein [Deltaproteobacteria bacterium]
MRQPLLILALIIFLALAGARQPALAGLHPTLDLQNIGGWALALEALSFAGYYMYKNSPAQRTRGYEENLGPGEWYLAAYSGLSYLPAADWQAFKNEGYIPMKGRTAKNIFYQPGVTGGLKFGRYFDSLPWFGIEVETSLSRNNIRGNQGRISPLAPGGPNNLFGGSDWFIDWTMQTSFLVRHGFLKDKEVTFGRLQPYVGLGPGWEVVYATHDSAKNYAIEAQAGVRYMITENLGLFCEYKFSYQFAIEYQDLPAGKQVPATANWSFDLPHHRLVLGVSYHFKNLYGN